VIAEGGAAQERILDTRSAYDLAMTEGCDFIQASFVPTKEGVLVARRNFDLAADTDVAARPEFASRKTTKAYNGDSVTGWFGEDFTLAELQTLTCREPDPAANPRNVRYNGKEAPLSLAEVLKVARDGCVRTGRTIGVCVRLLRTDYYAGLGFDVVQHLATDLGIEGYRAAASAIWVQCAESDALMAFGKLSPIRRMLVLTGHGDMTGKASQMLDPDGLTTIRGYAEGIAPDQDLLLNFGAARTPTPFTVAADARKTGLVVFGRATRGELQRPPSLRDEDYRSASFRSGDGDLDKLLVALYAAGVDGVATDLPAPATKARDAVLEAIARQRASKHG
jgi:glycerophosphoryl diester phosphodiesterase